MKKFLSYKNTDDNIIHLNQAKAERSFNEAYQSFRDGLVDEAIALYHESINLYPTPEAYTFLAWALSAKHEFEQAVELCQKAIELNPSYGNPYNDIGAYLMELGREDEAIIWLEKAVIAKDYDCTFFPYFNLGRIYQEKNQIKKAITCFEKALSIKPDFLSAKTMLESLKTSLN